MVRPKMSEWERLEAKRGDLLKRQEELQTRLAGLQEQVKEAIMNDRDPTGIYQQIAKGQNELQALAQSLVVIQEAQAKAEPDHLRQKLEEIEEQKQELARQ